MSIAPGLWYITGVAVRLAVDLGLHHEDGLDGDEHEGDPRSAHEKRIVAERRGRRQWMQDLRRRLWWYVRIPQRLSSEQASSLQSCNKF